MLEKAEGLHLAKSGQPVLMSFKIKHRLVSCICFTLQCKYVKTQTGLLSLPFLVTLVTLIHMSTS